MSFPLVRLFSLLVLSLAFPFGASAAESFKPYWVQAHRPTQLWSGQGEDAISFGEVPAWSYFQVVEPQQKNRLLVMDPRTNNYAYVEALDVGPSGPPPPPPSDPTPVPAEQPSQQSSPASPQQPAPPSGQESAPPANQQPAPPLSQDPAPPALQPAYQTWWVANHSFTPLWSSPADPAINLGSAPPFSLFEVLEPQQGSRLRVRDPLTGGEAYLDAASVGPAAAPSALEVPAQWWGQVGNRAINVRSNPTTNAELLGELPAGTPVLVRRWVEGEAVAADDPTWAELADGTYVWGSLLRKAKLDAPPPPPQVLAAPKWIDVNLTHQTVTAYEGDSPVYWALTASGRPGWETPTGIFSIQRRVENEIMDSSTLLGRDAQRADYRVENVRWTQYFTGSGAALHENYWKLPDTFGIPSSHGCLGLLANDAKWFWDWATIGTPVYIHH